jgi:hypothetical protein
VRVATHEFLAVCYEDTNTGAGTQGITAFQTAMTNYPDLVDNKLGSTGHSQGGPGGVHRAPARRGRSGLSRHEPEERGVLVVRDRSHAHPDAAGARFKTIPTGVTTPAWTKRMSENEAPCL